jgi:hypothetical protein
MEAHVSGKSASKEIFIFGQKSRVSVVFLYCEKTNDYEISQRILDATRT